MCAQLGLLSDKEFEAMVLKDGFTYFRSSMTKDNDKVQRFKYN